MAEMRGDLRPDKATYGEKMVYKNLKSNLPRDYTVYVECPINKKRQQKFPDFVVLTNFGFIVLEVKDWVQILEADKTGVKIRERSGHECRHRNPVDIAREYALDLTNELNASPLFRYASQKVVPPWGYAAIFPNIPLTKITQLRTVWGAEFVLGEADLAPGIIKDRLESTISLEHIRQLPKSVIDAIRSVIFPVVYFEPEGRSPMVLDDIQEQIVVEPIKPIVDPLPLKKTEEIQAKLEIPISEQEPASAMEEELLGDKLAKNTSIRLIRGVAGSGKTLVLTQRARYLAAQYPEWKLLVVSFNKELSRYFQTSFKDDKNITALTFHKLCDRVVGPRPTSPDDSFCGWLKNHQNDYPISQELSSSFLEQEIKWIIEIGINQKSDYLRIERKGRGRQVRLNSTQREQIYQLKDAYLKDLHNRRFHAWEEIPHDVLRKLSYGNDDIQPYDAILIDEAQDFAPVWLQVINRLLNPEHGVLFIADDPSQSIYRFYSWKEKGIQVTGRTRWLQVPYRNTFEIFSAAFSLIESDEELRRRMQEEGHLVIPDCDSSIMRHGDRPQLKGLHSFEQETQFIQQQIEYLCQRGYHVNQIAVLNPKKKGVEKLRRMLNYKDLNIGTYYAYKGLEYEVVILSQIQDIAEAEEEEEISEKKRLFYMAMTRARERLFMTYTSSVPSILSPLMDKVDILY